MEEIEITIVNWNRQQEWGEHRKMKENYRHHYFKLSNRIYGSYSLKDLSGDEFRCWIGLLCLASQGKSGNFRKTEDFICWELQVDKKILNSCLEKLSCNGTVTVLRHNCDSSEHKSRVEESRVEDWGKSFLNKEGLEAAKEAWVKFCDRDWLEKNLPSILLEYNQLENSDPSFLANIKKTPEIVRLRQMVKKRWDKEKKDKPATKATGPVGGVRV